MEIITGLDVSMASTSVCALNANGEIVSEAKVLRGVRISDGNPVDSARIF